MEKKTHCIVFDVFGTLYHYDRKIFTRDFIKTHGVLAKIVPELSLLEFGEIWKNLFLEKLVTAREEKNEFSLLDHASNVLNAITPSLRKNVIVARNLADKFVEEWLEEITINPYALAFLNELYAKNVLLAISNINDTKVLPQLFIKDEINKYFSLVLTSAAYGKRKPSEDLLRYAIDFLNLHDVELIIIGDDISDKEFAEKFNALFFEVKLSTKVNNDSSIYTRIINEINSLS